MKRKIIAVIPASGVGSRMQAEKPKQYLQLKGKTILEHTVSIFLEHPHVEKVIVAVARKDPFYSTLELLKSPKIQLVFGGETRADSVLNALQEINTENAWALVHDAARPCLKRSDLDKLLQINDPQGGILAIPAVDTMKRANGTKIAHTEDCSTLWHALTPQFFPAQALKQALSSAFANKLSGNRRSICNGACRLPATIGFR